MVLQPQIAQMAQIFLDGFIPFSLCLGGALWVAMSRHISAFIASPA
jgi:hypothetical protein